MIRGDEADVADEFIQRATEAAIAAARSNKLDAPYIGKCLYCEEPIAEKRWCNPECRDNWEKENG